MEQISERRSGSHPDLMALSDGGAIFIIHSRDPVEVRKAADIALDACTGLIDSRWTKAEKH